ncbi:dihydrodipicolinate reductase [Nocardia sp. NPDC057227]|uniref:NAD(P)H-dependent amine dehydrogenase family protein n=1 Tax=Nocardia sp. NPDC057227 TaxID=3346056 RepID=UPI003626B4A9
MTLRIVQWTTGNVGRAALGSIVERDDMELVGLYAFSADKVGRDAGDLARLGRTLGVAATDDIDAIIALRPDCVSYMPLYPDVEHLSRLLEAGINIVTTAEFMTGAALGAESRARLERAAAAGGASLFGSGVNPGWIEYVAAAASGVTRDLRSLRVIEQFDVTILSADGNQDDFGWGRPAGDPGHADDVAAGVAEFRDAVEVAARVLGVELDEIRYDVEFAHATEELTVAARTVTAGTVAGIEITWSGIADGAAVIELVARWTLGTKIEPPWTTDMGYTVEVNADPRVIMRIDFLPADIERITAEGMALMGTVLTASPAINAIPAVVAAAPGIVTYADLPPITANLAGR